MRVYTRAGDDGTTGRFLGGRVSKADAVVAACGDVDEAVSVLGVARAVCPDPELAAEGKLRAFRHTGMWLTVNTPKELRRADEYVAEHPEWLS